MLYPLIVILLLIAVLASYPLAYLYKFIERSYKGKGLFYLFAFLGIIIGYLIVGVALFVIFATFKI